MIQIYFFYLDIINEDDLWTALELLHQNGSIIGLLYRDILINEKSKVNFFFNYLFIFIII